MTPELYRPLAIDRIGPNGQTVDVVATESECAAVAARLDVPELKALACRFELTRAGLEVLAEATLRALLVRTCVVSTDLFEMETEHRFRIRFVPAGTEPEEIDPEQDYDDIPYSGTRIDLGEAAVEELALSLDPYPRKPDAVIPSFDDAPSASPFDVLARGGSGLRGRS